MKNQKRNLVLILMVLVVTSMLPAVCSATAMPWDSPLTSLKENLSGQVATAVVVITIVITGLMIAFGEAGAAGRKMIQIVFGFALALGGASGVMAIFGTQTTGVIFQVLK